MKRKARRFKPCPHCRKVAGYSKFEQLAHATTLGFAGWHEPPGDDVWTTGWTILGMLSGHIVTMDASDLASYRRKRAPGRIDVCRNCGEAVT